MRIFGGPLIGAMAIAALAPALAVTPMSVQPDRMTVIEAPSRPSRKRKVAMPAWGGKPVRSRGVSAPRKKKSNRLHVSRRVRRKHRRAA